MISEFVGPGFGSFLFAIFRCCKRCLTEEKWCLRSYSHENQTDSKLLIFEYEKNSFYLKVHVLVGNSTHTIDFAFHQVSIDYFGAFNLEECELGRGAKFLHI